MERLQVRHALRGPIKVSAGRPPPALTTWARALDPLVWGLLHPLSLLPRGTTHREHVFHTRQQRAGANTQRISRRPDIAVLAMATSRPIVVCAPGFRLKKLWRVHRAADRLRCRFVALPVITLTVRIRSQYTGGISCFTSPVSFRAFCPGLE